MDFMKYRIDFVVSGFSFAVHSDRMLILANKYIPLLSSAFEFVISMSFTFEFIKIVFRLDNSCAV